MSSAGSGVPGIGDLDFAKPPTARDANQHPLVGKSPGLMVGLKVARHHADRTHDAAQLTARAIVEAVVVLQVPDHASLL